MIDNNKLPSISVIIPTLNAGKVLDQCLGSIKTQDYPAELVEIIIADGGSVDNTLEIAKKYNAKIVSNQLKTGEAGKAVALNNSVHELVALVDSDNILPQNNWFRMMVQPFVDDPAVSVSEPIRFTWRPQDGFITRYCALIGANDPLVIFLGNYDRENLLTGQWTGVDVGYQDDRGDYVLVNLTKSVLPTIGANGTLLKREFLGKIMTGSYLFDIDIISRAILQGASVKVAKVRVGIVHLYCGSSVTQFIKKQNRRIMDFIYHQKKGTRVYSWHKQKKSGIVKFCIYSLLVFPTLLQSFYGFSKKRDPAWFFHPIACSLTLWVYTLGTIRNVYSNHEAGRKNWSQ